MIDEAAAATHINQERGMLCRFYSLDSVVGSDYDYGVALIRHGHR